MTTPSTQFQDLVGEFYSRRLLLVNNPSPPPSTGPGTPSSSEPDNSFDSNVVMVLSVLLCALICSLGLNSIIRCALRCSSFVASDDSSSSGASRANSARRANTGVKRKALRTFPVVTYSPELNLPGLDSECVICISEFTHGERIRLLPKCNHGFHVRCIDKWLSSHSSCPTCRHCLIDTCQKIVASYSSSSQVTATSAPPQSQVSATSAPPPLPQSQVTATSAPPAVHLISIPPLEPEGFVRNYRGEGN